MPKLHNQLNKIYLSEKLEEISRANGIDLLGFADASEFAGYALERSIRRDPRLSLPGSQTIIVAGVYIGGASLPAWSDPWHGRTSRLYLSGYFLDVTEPLMPMARFLRDYGYKAMICDGAGGASIIPLKLAAVRAGLGWQGKHSLLLTRKFGTFLALGGILTDAILKHNRDKRPDRCGTCNKCREACPVSALDQPYVLNRERCLASLLMSDRLPGDVKHLIENRVVDCEICQDACPWNKRHLESPLQTKLTTSFLEKQKAWEDLFYLPALAEITEEEYQKRFVEPLKSDISYKAFSRNVQSALERAEKLKRLHTD